MSGPGGFGKIVVQGDMGEGGDDDDDDEDPDDSGEDVDGGVGEPLLETLVSMSSVT